MKFKKAMKTWSRMCEKYENMCSLCELSKLNTGSHLLCHKFMQFKPKQAEKILKEWETKNGAIL